jgi:hypothetical protein
MSTPLTTQASAVHAPAPETPDLCDAVERPAVVWWVLVLGGLSVLGLQSWNAEFYGWWTSHVNALPGQAVMSWIFIACIPIHAGEAIYVYLAAPRSGLTRSRTGWAIQTLVLGYPSTHLFRRRAARLRSRTGAE